jgi:murein DD-endopeptidase MepM/ murein hydrolase activator NlpD
MLVSILSRHSRTLGRSVAVLLVAGAATGCSSQMTRFNSADDIFTGSTENQRQILNGGGQNQPYPGDVATAPTYSAPPADPVYTGSVQRGALPSPTSTAPAPAQTAAVRPAPSSSRSGSVPFGMAEPETGVPVAGARSEPSPQAPATASDPAGWSRAGGTQIKVRDGETVYNISKRYGVPANVITQVNGLPNGSSLRSGQTLVIPTYVYSQKAPVSAPDANQQVADANSGRGTRFDPPADNVPVPSRAPKNETVAVLPNAPKVREVPIGQSGSDQPKAAAPTVAGGSYTVQSGDTLSAIARKTGTRVADLKAANGMQDGVLRIGQQLKVPQGGSIVVAEAPAGNAQKVDATTTGATQPQPTQSTSTYTAPEKPAEKVIQQAVASPDVAPNATGVGKMRWPVRGRVISSYGKGGGKSNDGIDIAVPEGTAVKAAENGVVIYAGDGLKEFGNTVLVRHEDGLVTVYGHASQLKVQRGQKVKRGDEIAVSGMSGNASTPKLHFEVRKNSSPVDPSSFLE